MAFSHDRDLLIFEPRLFAELVWPAQQLAAGADGSLVGAMFLSPSADFITAAVQSGMVLNLRAASADTDAPPASVEIVRVDSPTQLLVSALRVDSDANAVPPVVAGDGFAWQIVSFAAQADAVQLEMLAHFGLSPADSTSPWTAEDITRPEALRVVSAHGVLAAVLAGAATRDTADGYWAKAMHYRRLFERGMAKVRLGLDSTGDGRPNVARDMGSPRLRRD